jgi:hypothetical protein
LLSQSRLGEDEFVGKRAVAVLSILAALVAGAVLALTSSGDDPTVATSPTPDRTSSLFVEPEGTDADACGDYIATWLDLLHAEDAFPINELKADLGQGPLWLAVTDAWSDALELETRMPQEEAARRVVPTIASACEDPDVRAQFLQLQSI